MRAPPKELIRFIVYIGVYAKHINLGFYWGARMDDPEGVLEGRGSNSAISRSSRRRI